MEIIQTERAGAGVGVGLESPKSRRETAKAEMLSHPSRWEVLVWVGWGKGAELRHHPGKISEDPSPETGLESVLLKGFGGEEGGLRLCFRRSRLVYSEGVTVQTR